MLKHCGKACGLCNIDQDTGNCFTYLEFTHLHSVDRIYWIGYRNDRLPAVGMTPTKILNEITIIGPICGLAPIWYLSY